MKMYRLYLIGPGDEDLEALPKRTWPMKKEKLSLSGPGDEYIEVLHNWAW